MNDHSHCFVDNYKGFVGFGFNRETDENTVKYYLQKFSDDDLLETLVKKMSDKELAELFDIMARTLKKHLTESQYHALFLKE